MTKKWFLLLAFSCINYAYSMEQEIEDINYHSILVPGINGNGCETFTQYNLCTTGKTRIDELKGYKIDLGQGNCITDFEKQLSKFENTKFLFFGASQGTATLVNWLAQKKQNEQESIAGCLYLEAVLGNGNNAIIHNAERLIPAAATYLPFARFWIPFIAKFLFPTYNPFGKQALTSALKLSPNIPVIIFHNINDLETPINDARRLYYNLTRKRTKKNTYLIEVSGESCWHANLLMALPRKERMKILSIINAIYAKHNLPLIRGFEEPAPDIDLSKYQPKPQSVLEKINKSNDGTKTRNLIDQGCTALCLGLATTYLYSKDYFSKIANNIPLLTYILNLKKIWN